MEFLRSLIIHSRQECTASTAALVQIQACIRQAATHALPFNVSPTKLRSTDSFLAQHYHDMQRSQSSKHKLLTNCRLSDCSCWLRLTFEF